MSVLDGFRVLQVGPGLAAAVCGRIFADIGATVARTGADFSSILSRHLNRGPNESVSDPDLIVAEGITPADIEALRKRYQHAALVLISPFGQTGPRAGEPATDLTLFFASGIGRMLTGQVDDLDEPPMRPVGEQSAFIGGLAGACAGMHAALLGDGSVIDVSIHEALATLAITELTKAGKTGKSWSRKRVGDGNGATVCILPAADGYTAISPREDRQWASWLEAMGSPSWGRELRFATKTDRVANWDALHALMCEWSRDKPKRWIAQAAQAAHVPSFPLCEPHGHLESEQLRHRGFFCKVGDVTVPGSPFGISLADSAAVPSTPGSLPLSGVRVLDFSWVIAGPTATRYLAAMGAEVIKIEAPGRGDPGRTSELHSVLGQAKRAIVLDLKKPEAIAIAKALAAKSDVLIENFATGVMDRLGLGAEALRAINPNLIYVSASGLGRSGPESHAVAYGTLLQCYAGFAGLNRHPGVLPRVGMAWLDPMCGLMLAFITAAALWRRRSGGVVRVDFSMIEAMLWTMAGPLLGEPGMPNPAAIRRIDGPDDWIAVEPAHASNDLGALHKAGIAASTLARSADLVASPHLRARGFWDEDGLPGLPWVASFGRATGAAPALGADTDAVLRDVLGLAPAAVAGLRAAGAVG